MIKKIIELKNIGRFVNFQQMQDFAIRVKEHSNNCNIIFGFNGSGKSTISNVLSLFGDGSFSKNKPGVLHDITRDESDIPSIKLELQDGQKLLYSDTTREGPIYVFNSNFVSDHVSNGVRKFNGANDGLTTPELQDINNKIEELEKNKRDVGKEIERLQKEFEKIKRAASNDFNKKFPSLRLNSLTLDNASIPQTTEIELEKQKDNLILEYEHSTKSVEIANNITQLQSISLNQINLDIKTINDLLGRTITQLSKSALEDRIQNIKNKFTNSESGAFVEEWFRRGKQILEQPGMTHCPICNSDLTGQLETILQDFDGYFDKKYDEFINMISGHIASINTISAGLQSVDGNVNAIEALYSKYKDILPELHYIKPDVVGVRNALNIIKICLENKLQNISLTDTVPAGVFDCLMQFNSDITSIISLKTELLKKLQSIAPRKQETIIKDIKGVYKSLAIIEFNRLDSDYNMLAVYNAKKQELEHIDTTDMNDEKGLLYWNNKRVMELSKIKAESAGINKFLKNMGIETFTIDLRDKPGEEKKDIVVNYANSTSEKPKQCLSDGEKTALGFAYFLSKFENELDESSKTNAIVVIDDPISSLDENRLYSTAHLIKDMFDKTKQLIVLSHNFLFLKFFNAVYPGNPQQFFMNKDSLGSLPDELANFETTYFYMLKDIQKFNNSTIEYKNARKYLPNFIRRVLETFFAFKFAMLWARNDKNKRSPGLKDAKGYMEESHYDKNLIDKLDKIIDITDKQCHGSAQTLTDNNSYISEDDLKQIAKNAIEIIEIMDNSHLQSIKKFGGAEQDNALTQKEKADVEEGRAIKVPENSTNIKIANTDFIP